MTSPDWAQLRPDRARAHAVLIGSGFFRHLAPLPQAGANVAALAAALTGPTGLFDPGLLRTRVDPTRVSDVLGLLPHSVPPKPDVLLFFYTGHGVQDGDGQLVLALRGTVDDERNALATGLPIRHVFDTMRHTKARHLIAVLDCCYAERAVDAPGAQDIHLLLAAGRTERAWSPPGAEYSRFTGALLDLLGKGVPDGPDLLDLATVFRHLSAVLTPLDSEPKPPEAPHLSWPSPRQRTVDASGGLVLGRNPAFGTGNSREGLAARARFATRVGRAGQAGRPLAARPERRAQAARLFAGIVADAARTLPADDRLRLRLRHAYASAVGTLGDVARAHQMLQDLVKDWEATADPAASEDDPWLTAARASRDHWSRTATP